MPLLEGYEGNAINFNFWFHPTTNQNKLVAFQNANRYPYHLFTSIIDDTDRLEWRHLACVHDSQGSFSFYLNGNQWPISARSVHPWATVTVAEVQTMNIGFRNDGVHRFFGNMACIMIFDQALTADAIKSVRSVCG